MKKILFILLAALLFLVACNKEETKEKTEGSKQDQPTEETLKQDPEEESNVEAEDEEKDDSEKIQKETKALTDKEVKEILEFSGMGEDDNLISASVKKGEVKATIELAPDDMLSAEDLAVTRYSQASDELLNHEGWGVLSITYANVGTISMNRSEKETNELDMDYFPIEEITKRLK
ncbi:hypothetical protein ACQKP0_25460 [Heyndrickxia sp. NPDC080065]|uniref:hypothetical protein n=1 Tax=Heyndrickxia sp. NPDC080065 TaxID=3390568 RepID=UPI003CFF915A